MSIYAEIEKINPDDTTGHVNVIVDMGSHIPESSQYIYFIDITGYTPQPVADEVWWFDFTNDEFTTIEPVVNPRVTRSPMTNAIDLWFTRFTADERAKVWAICRKDDPAGVSLTLAQRYKIASFRDVTVSGLSFKLDDIEVTSVVHGLETAGVIDAGRADEILNR